MLNDVVAHKGTHFGAWEAGGQGEILGKLTLQEGIKITCFREMSQTQSLGQIIKPHLPANPSQSPLVTSWLLEGTSPPAHAAAQVGPGSAVQAETWLYCAVELT